MRVDCISEAESDTSANKLRNEETEALLETNSKALKEAETQKVVRTPCDVETEQ